MNDFPSLSSDQRATRNGGLYQIQKTTSRFLAPFFRAAPNPLNSQASLGKGMTPRTAGSDSWKLLPGTTILTIAMMMTSSIMILALEDDLRSPQILPECLPRHRSRSDERFRPLTVKAATGLPPRDSAGPPGGSEPPAGPPAGPSRGGYPSPAYGNLPAISENPSEFNAIVSKQLDTIVRSRGYKDADKFSGKRYCFLRTKPGDFLDRCQRANLHENDLGRAFPLMLTGIADDHNVHAVANRNMTYYEMINKLRD